MYLKSAPGLNLRPEQGIWHSIKKFFFTKLFKGKKNKLVRFLGDLEKPTEVKETLEYG